MPEPLYRLNARLVGRLHAALLETLESHPSYYEDKSQFLPLMPDKARLAELLDIAYRASLRREEGRETRFRLTFVEPERALPEMPFERPVDFSVDSLVKLAPALGPENFVAVSAPGDGALKVWGIARHAGDLHCAIEAVDPGVISLKLPPSVVALVTADDAAILAGRDTQIIGTLVAALAPSVAERDRLRIALLLAALAPLMRAAGHGGAVLVVPGERSRWKGLLDLTYEIRHDHDQSGYVEALDGRNPAAALAAVEAAGGQQAGWDYDRELLRLHRDGDVQRSYRRALARLSAVDGAVVLESTRKLVAFGAKILPRDPERPLPPVTALDPAGRRAGRDFDLSGRGTRHRSAAGFASDVEGAVALVVSQDGAITFFFSDREKVYAVPGAEASLL